MEIVNQGQVQIKEDFLPEYMLEKLDLYLKGKDISWHLAGTAPSSNPNGLDIFHSIYQGYFHDDNTVENMQYVYNPAPDDPSIKRDDYFLGWVSHIHQMIEKEFGFKVYDVKRIKFNRVHQNPDFEDHQYNPPHTDVTPNMDPNGVEYKTLLLYLDDSDGDTFFFDNPADLWEQDQMDLMEYFQNIPVLKRETPKKNKAAFFNCCQIHASTPPRKSSVRMVMNYIVVGKTLDK
jgi:hypothetical protein